MRSLVWEELGNVPNDPENSRRARGYFGFVEDASRETPLRNVAPVNLETAVRIVDLRKGDHDEYVSRKEYLGRLKQLRDAGYPLEYRMTYYRNMPSHKLHAHFLALSARIQRQYQEAQAR